GADGPALLEDADGAFHIVPLAVEFLVEVGTAALVEARLVFALGKHGADVVAPGPMAYGVVAVAFVAHQHACAAAGGARAAQHTHAANHGLDAVEVGGLPCRHGGRDDIGVSLARQVQFGGETAAGAPQGVVLGLLGAPLFPPPAAAREARTTEES